MAMQSSPTTVGLRQNSSVLVIGGGTWGVSTALHLARRSYVNITVLDAHPTPSPIAAGNDINKILEFSDTSEDGDSATLANAARDGWQTDPVFKGLFHETGAICAATSEEGKHALECDYSEEHGWQRVETAEQFRELMPLGVLTGDFPGWKGWSKGAGQGCGWVEARNALVSAAKEAQRLGVKFITGEQGQVTSLIYEDGDVKGAVTSIGELFRADRTILCAGANAAGLMDLKDQLRPTAWTLAHIKMTEEECKLYKDLPVLFNIERGFFMEPDTEKHELKICDEHPGYCNWGEASPQDTGRRQSVPFARHQIPKEAEERIRTFLRETMPHLAEHPFSFARICWCADTPDRAFLISRHPEFPSLVLGVGGSGHGFSFIPAIGGVIADCLEGIMDKDMERRYRWRPETAQGRDWMALQGRFGPPGSNHVMDFQKVETWTTI